MGDYPKKGKMTGKDLLDFHPMHMLKVYTEQTNTFVPLSEYQRWVSSYL